MGIAPVAFGPRRKPCPFGALQVGLNNARNVSDRRRGELCFEVIACGIARPAFAPGDQRTALPGVGVIGDHAARQFRSGGAQALYP